MRSSRLHDTSGTTLGRLVQAWRIRALLTQEELAARAGLSARTIRRLERAPSPARPRLTSLRLLAEALDLDDAERTTLASLSHGAPPVHLAAAGGQGRGPGAEGRPR